MLTALAASGWAPACSETTVNEYVDNHYYLGGAGQGGNQAQGGDGRGPDPGPGPEPEPGPQDYPAHRPNCERTMALADLPMDLFGEDGNLFYLEVNKAAREAGDAQACNGQGGGLPEGGGVYDLGDAGSGTCPLAAENVRIVPYGSKVCTDTGKVELDLAGQSSFRQWASIPNFKLDVGQFQKKQRFPSGDKTLRFNNGQAESTIVREPVALRIWRALGYPAPKTAFAKLRSNVWDNEFQVGASATHALIQPYKGQFFEESLPEAAHVWEGVGDPLGGWFDKSCQWSSEEECDEDALKEVLSYVQSAPRGKGYMAATSDYVDWTRLHENQCLAALTGTGDDWIHNNNNVVLVLTSEGKILFLPYSTDISGNHPWYQNTPYDGGATLIQACKEDADCRLQALNTCESLLDDYDQLDVVENIVNERCEVLKDRKLDRAPDEAVCEALRDYYGERSTALREEIQCLREELTGGGLGGAGGNGGGGISSCGPGGGDGGVDGWDGWIDGGVDVIWDGAADGIPK